MWLPFLVFMISAFAETNRLPFDLPEAEQELVGGYHTEYSSMKFAMFFLGEYANMFVASALMVTLFFGGWSLPFAPFNAPAATLGVGIAHVADFPGEGLRVPVLFHLGALDYSAISLRSIDGRWAGKMFIPLTIAEHSGGRARCSRSWRGEADMQVQRPKLTFWEKTYLPQIVHGLWLTLKHIPKKKFTRQYPEEQPLLHGKYRGAPMLVRDPEGRVKCVAVPALRIRLSAQGDPRDARTPARGPV